MQRNQLQSKSRQIQQTDITGIRLTHSVPGSSCATYSKTSCIQDLIKTNKTESSSDVNTAAGIRGNTFMQYFPPNFDSLWIFILKYIYIDRSYSLFSQSVFLQKWTTTHTDILYYFLLIKFAVVISLHLDSGLLPKAGTQRPSCEDSPQP